MIGRRQRRPSAPAWALAFTLAASLAARSASAAIHFGEVEGAFVGQGCRDGAPEAVGCWTNYLRLTDLDGDGDLDAVFPNASGFFTSPGAQPLEIYLNDGHAAFEAGTAALLGEAVEGAYRVVAIGDIDGDRRPDLFLPSAAGEADRLFVQDGDGAFTDEAATRLGTSSRSAAARFGDVDGDGDLDLLVAAGYAASDSPPARLYLNDGGGAFEEADDAIPAEIAGTDPVDLDLVDVDGDSDLDVLVSAHTGSNALWINDGTGRFADESSRLPALEDPDAYHYGPVACDIDGDGDRDILLDNVGPSYGEQVLVNDGAGYFSAQSDRLDDNPPGTDDNGIVCLDFDDDGNLDLVVVALSSSGERLFANDGTGHFTRVDGAFSAIVDPTLWMEAGDLDGDGRLDVVTAQGEGDGQLERLYLGSDEVAVDASAPRIFAVDGARFWPEVRFAVQDNATSDEGPRLQGAEARLGGAEAPIAASFMGGDLYRVVVPEASAGFELCATDLAGNLGCVAVSPPGGGGGGGAGGSGGTAGDGVGGAPHTTTAATSSSAGSAGDGGGEVAILGDDGGCGCEVVGGKPSSRSSVAGLAMAMAAGLASRRRGVSPTRVAKEAA